MALDLNRSPPYDEELLPDLNNLVVDEELLQQDHNLDGAEFAGRQQQLISLGNYSCSISLNCLIQYDFYMNNCSNFITLTSCLLLLININQLRVERPYQISMSNLQMLKNFTKSKKHKQTT